MVDIILKNKMTPEEIDYFLTIFNIQFGDTRDDYGRLYTMIIGNRTEDNNIFAHILKPEYKELLPSMLTYVYKTLVNNDMLDNDSYKKFILKIIYDHLKSFDLVGHWFFLADSTNRLEDKNILTIKIAYTAYLACFDETTGLPTKLHRNFALGKIDLDGFLGEVEKVIATADYSNSIIRSFPRLDDDLFHAFQLYERGNNLLVNQTEKFNTKIEKYNRESSMSGSAFFFPKDLSVLKTWGDFIAKNKNNTESSIKIFIQHLQYTLVKIVSSNWRDVGTYQIAMLGGILQAMFPDLTITNLQTNTFALEIVQRAFSLK